MLRRGGKLRGCTYLSDRLLSIRHCLRVVQVRDCFLTSPRGSYKEATLKFFGPLAPSEVQDDVHFAEAGGAMPGAST